MNIRIYKSADGSGVHTRSSNSGRRERRKVSSARRKRFRWIHRAGKTQAQLFYDVCMINTSLKVFVHVWFVVLSHIIFSMKVDRI